MPLCCQMVDKYRIPKANYLATSAILRELNACLLVLFDKLTLVWVVESQKSFNSSSSFIKSYRMIVNQFSCCKQVTGGNVLENNHVGRQISKFIILLGRAKPCKIFHLGALHPHAPSEKRHWLLLLRCLQQCWEDRKESLCQS